MQGADVTCKFISVRLSWDCCPVARRHCQTVFDVCVAANDFICSSFGQTAKMHHLCTVEPFCSCFMMSKRQVLLLFLEKCNLILINLLETFWTGNILISMSLVSRTDTYQFLLDCPSLSLCLHHLGFSLSSPDFFSLFSDPPCFPQSCTQTCKLMTIQLRVQTENTKLSLLCYASLSTFFARLFH